MERLLSCMKPNKRFIALFITLFMTLVLVVPAQEVNAERGDVDPSIWGGYSNETEIDYDRATINKQVVPGDKPGEFFIELKVTGKENRTIESADIVLVYDNSVSMGVYRLEGRTRAEVAKEATTEFINELFNLPDHRFRIALVSYGSSIFDGVMVKTGQMLLELLLIFLIKPLLM